jgi:hypothetical protein
MKRTFRLMLAFLWLTVGYWTLSFVLQFALLLLPFAHTGSGILHSGPASNGVHTVQFHGAPGDAVLVFVTQDGEKKVTFSAKPPTVSSFSTTMAWDNAYSDCFLVGLFALISLPILSRLLRRAPNESAPPNGGPAEPLANSGVDGGPPSVS